MNTAVKEKSEKVQANFRFEKSFMNALKQKAKKEKRSVNNFVEVVLSDYLYENLEPNAETIAAMEESENDDGTMKRYKSVKNLMEDLMK